MSPVRYDYERGHGDGSGSSRVRAVIIFIIALGLIGCGIYFFILPHRPDSPAPVPSSPSSGVDPKTDSPVKGPENRAAASGKTAGGNASSPAPDVPENRADSTDKADKTAEVDPPPSAEQSGEAKNTETGGDDAPANPTDLSGNGGKTAAPSDETPTEEPQKGKPWIGDPPDEKPAAPDGTAAPPRPVDPAESAVTVTVHAGDSLSRIAQRHHTTVEALRHYNKLKKDVIRIGQKLRVIPGPWRITVNKGQRVLTLERLGDGNWSEFAKFPVGLGRLNSTPDAQFVISTRLRHPDWYMPDGRIYRYGDPENQLGDYFLKLAMTGTPDKPLLGYGIHGTPDENSVGKNWSNGCVRMRNCDVEILYYLVPSGTPVKIVPGADEPRKTEI